VDRIIAVASGKGGVGKSTVAVNVALGLRHRGYKVGLLDCDVYGPSIPLLLGVEERPSGTPDGKIAPINALGLSLMSIGFFSRENQPMIWRGPIVLGVVSQFLSEVDWGTLDFLIVDMPPGTGDASLTLVQRVPVTGAVIVTTPSDVALIDAQKGLNMYKRVNVPVLGIVENMSYFECDGCGHREYIFGKGLGRKAAAELKVPFLGEIPLDPVVRAQGDASRPVVSVDPDGASARPFMAVADALLQQLEGGEERAASAAGPRRKGLFSMFRR
jgi:ATP-binding protein involved in chromosome partitioning